MSGVCVCGCHVSVPSRCSNQRHLSRISISHAQRIMSHISTSHVTHLHDTNQRHLSRTSIIPAHRITACISTSHVPYLDEPRHTSQRHQSKTSIGASRSVPRNCSRTCVCVVRVYMHSVWVLCHLTGFARLVRGRSKYLPCIMQIDLCISWFCYFLNSFPAFFSCPSRILPAPRDGSASRVRRATTYCNTRTETHCNTLTATKRVPLESMYTG